MCTVLCCAVIGCGRVFDRMCLCVCVCVTLCVPVIGHIMCCSTMRWFTLWMRSLGILPTHSKQSQACGKTCAPPQNTHTHTHTHHTPSKHSALCTLRTHCARCRCGCCFLITVVMSSSVSHIGGVELATFEQSC